MVESLNMNDVVKNMHVLFITFDSLRYDVAAKLFEAGKTPNLEQSFPEGWQKCSSPGSFTYAAHQAFFAGFLPTLAIPEKQPRLFAANFAGSETTDKNTKVFETADIVSGFSQLGFKTVCIGGVGFFNKQTALGNVLPSLFEESFWDTSFGVTDPTSTENQIKKAVEIINENKERQLFMFINFSAIHQPNYFYASNIKIQDSVESHAAALQYVDSKMPALLNAFQQMSKDTFCIFCSDHGTAYGEDGYVGHRIGHPTVWEVPMATFVIKQQQNNP